MDTGRCSSPPSFTRYAARGTRPYVDGTLMGKGVHGRVSGITVVRVMRRVGDCAWRIEMSNPMGWIPTINRALSLSNGSRRVYRKDTGVRDDIRINNLRFTDRNTLEVQTPRAEVGMFETVVITLPVCAINGL